MPIKYILISFLFIYFPLLSSFLFPQETVTVAGTVVDSDDEDPLAGANVLVKGMAVGMVTNKQISPGDFTTEKVSTYEVGYRGVINENLLIDAYYYFSAYTDFGAQINTVQSAGPDNDLQGDGVPPFAGEANPVGIVQNNINVQNFLTTINADGVVASHGFAVGVDYGLDRGFVIGGNIGYNALLNQNELEEQGLETFYNTPEWRYNLMVMNRKVTDNFGFSLFWRWQSSFVWNVGIGQGRIPAYQTLDAQVSYKMPTLKTVLKIGGSNILNERYTNSIGNVRVGAVYYVSLTFDQFMN